MATDDDDGAGECSDCPLCCNALDATDRHFRPCRCGYQICAWCWHQRACSPTTAPRFVLVLLEGENRIISWFTAATNLIREPSPLRPRRVLPSLRRGLAR
jgi:hypothetical protein